MSESVPPGGIFALSAYAQGKCLDHSAWHLPNKRRLSDIDAVLDCDGHVLFVELARAWGPISWGHLSGGQRWLYSSIARLSPKAACILARHAVVSLDRAIDTRADIADAVVLFDGAEKALPITGDEYRLLVELWGSEPAAALEWLRGKHAAWWEVTQKETQELVTKAREEAAILRQQGQGGPV